MRTVDEVYESLLRRLPAPAAHNLTINPDNSWAVVLRAIAGEIADLGQATEDRREGDLRALATALKDA